MKDMERSKVSFKMIFPVLLLWIVAGAGCAQKAPDIRIEDQQAKRSPILIGVWSVFMKIVNNGRGDDALISAGVNIPHATAELHDVKNGKMAKVERIRIPAGSTVALRPMGFHIMIFRMPEDLKSMREIPLSLSFEKSGEKQILVSLLDAAETRTQNPR